MSAGDGAYHTACYVRISPGALAGNLESVRAVIGARDPLGCPPAVGRSATSQVAANQGVDGLTDSESA